MAAATKSSKSSMINISDILGQCSVKNIEDELCNPRLRIMKDMSFVPPKYLYIKKLIPLVLDLHKVQYTCWSALFCNTARSYNLFHHIDPTTARVVDDSDRTLWRQQDAIVVSWIYATISPYLLAKLGALVPWTTSAMNVWACLRDICHEEVNKFQRQVNTTMQMQQNKKRRNYQGSGYNMNDGLDLISTLPDDLLVYVMSLVADMKTTARTCIVSKRWTHIWTQLMHLDFKDSVTFSHLNYLSYAQPEMDKFVDRVNQVIIKNQASYLDTFRINFPLNSFYAADIHNWLKFAIAKGVHNLDLNFGPGTYPRINILNVFSEDPALIFNTTLTSFHLKSVTFKQTMLQRVLSNCVNLQRLSLHHCKASPDDDSASLKHHRKLVVSSPKLQHLEFFGSLKLLNIKVLHLRAPNLRSLILYESEIDVEYRSVPSFVDATFGGSYSHQIMEDSNSLSGFSYQLEKLSIRWYKVRSLSSRWPNFVNVRQLEIVCGYGHDNLILATSLIQGCPLLHTFKLKMMCSYNEPMHLSAPNYAQQNAIRSHQHLKIVEYIGYAGCLSAAELATCLAWHAPMLQKFIFDTCRPQYIGNPHKSSSSGHQDQTEITIVRRTELLAERLQRSRYPIDVVIKQQE